MKTTRIPLLAGAVLLALASTACLAHNLKSFEVDFDKCFDRNGDAPQYLFTFSGPATGDVRGTLESRIIRFDTEIQPLQTFIEVDYVVTGTLPFTARLGGRLNDKTGKAVLDGYVSVGPSWLVGARVHDEFFSHALANGTPCAKGTLYITPRWKQSHGDNDD
jgi:hypothetical protein